MNMSHGKCHGCGQIGYFAECKDVKSVTEPAKVVHNEVIGLLTVNEDPSLSKMRRRGWYLSIRCTVHVCNSRDMFVDYQPWSGHEEVVDFNNRVEVFNNRVEVLGIGSVVLQFLTGNVLKLSNVFHIPISRKCMVSVGELNAIGCYVSFGGRGATIKRYNGIVGRGYHEDGLIRLGLAKPDIEPAKVVHNEVIGLITIYKDPSLVNMRRGWYLDSRCTVHVCSSRDMLVEYHPWSGHEVMLDNDKRVDVEGIGTVVIRFTTGKVLTLSNVFHIPGISKCLVSRSKLAESGFEISVGDGGASIKKNHELVGEGCTEYDMFRLSVIE